MLTPHDADLFDLLMEDDYLLPPSLTGDFDGFRLSSARLLPDGAGNGDMLRTLSQRNGYEPNRKSQAWHTAFLTNEGILDAEELMLYNPGLSQSEPPDSRPGNASKSSQILKSKPPETYSCSYSMPSSPSKGTRPGNACKSSRILKSKQPETYSCSYSMPSSPSKRTSTSGSVPGHKKQQSWLSTGIRSSAVSSSTSGSVKKMLKSSISFLKKKVGSGKAAPSASSTSPALPSNRAPPKDHSSMTKMRASSKDGLFASSPHTPPNKDLTTRFTAADWTVSSARRMSFSFPPPTKETMYQTPGSRPSGLRLPSLRFGFFDLEERKPRSRWGELYNTAPKKVRGAALSPVPYLPTPHSGTNDKENKFQTEIRVDNLSKHLSSIDLESDPRGKKGTIIQLGATGHSATPPLKPAAVSSVTQRTALATYNRSLHYRAPCRN